MIARSALFSIIAKAVVKNVAKAVYLEFVWDVASDVWEEVVKYQEQQRRATVEALAQASDGEIQAEAKRISQQVATGLPEAQRRQVETYLRQVPSMIRKSLRRSADPTGRTVPAAMSFSRPEDFVGLLPPCLPRFQPGDRPLPGVDWQLEELLGVGGFGEVWKARNPHLSHFPPVALKFCLDTEAKDRLLKHEAAVLGRVMQQGKHEGIVRLQHTYLTADPPCLEYEFIDGGDLTNWIRERQQAKRGLKPEQATMIVTRLAEIMAFAHSLNPPIVHRDLKPANVLVQHQPGGKLSLKVADFGIGGLAVNEAIDQSRRSTRREHMLATALQGAYTPLYASPQQMRGEPPDPRDDVYSLGVIWYQLLTGDLTTGIAAEWREEVQSRGLKEELIQVLAGCITSKPDKRLATASVLAKELKRSTASKSVPVAEPVAAASPDIPKMPLPQPDSIATPTPIGIATVDRTERSDSLDDPQQLRAQLLQNLNDVELRRRYLARRTPEQRAQDEEQQIGIVASGVGCLVVMLTVLGLWMSDVAGLCLASFLGFVLLAILFGILNAIGVIKPEPWRQLRAELGPLPADAPSDLTLARQQFLGDPAGYSPPESLGRKSVRWISTVIQGIVSVIFVLIVGLVGFFCLAYWMGGKGTKPQQPETFPTARTSPPNSTTAP